MHLFLSPHYDDAIYSAGGWIYTLVQQRVPVLIYTLMGGAPPAAPPDTPIICDIHRRWGLGEAVRAVSQRREEDRRAAAVLGASTQWADVPDCIYRTAGGTALYPTEASLFGPIHPDDPALAAAQAGRPPPGVDLSACTVLYAPLGVGHHVDHQIVRDWSLAIARRFPHLTLKFYTDYPYTRDATAIARALAGIPRRLVPEPLVLTSAAVATRIRAMQAYASQISTFWRDEAHLDADVRAAFCGPDGCCVERCWHPAGERS